MPLYVWFLILAVLSSLSVGCSNQTSADPTLVTIALDQPPENLDPRVGQNASSQRMAGLLFNSLVKKNDRLEIEPDVAVSWNTPDSKTYVFHLRTDVTFHDGRPLTSKDVVFTFRSLFDGSIRTSKSGYPFSLIDSVEAPDAYTVVFKLKEVFTPFIWNLARGAIGIVPEGAGPDFRRRPIGSGPFVFDHYYQDQEVVMKRNDAYFGEKALVSGLRFKIIPEAIVQALELRKGTADITLNVLTPDMIEVMKKE